MFSLKVSRLDEVDGEAAGNVRAPVQADLLLHDGAESPVTVGWPHQASLLQGEVFDSVDVVAVGSSFVVCWWRRHPY